MSMYYVYVLQSLSDTGLYIGFSTDLKRRLKQHNAGESQATSHRGPWCLVYYEAYRVKQDAEGRERFLKSGAGRRYLAKQCVHWFSLHPQRGTECDSTSDNRVDGVSTRYSTS
jgi:putative endonuclease